MRRYTESCCIYMERIMNLIDYLYLFVTRFNLIGVKYKLRYVFNSFLFAFCRVSIRVILAVILGIFIVVVTVFGCDLLSHVYAMENDGDAFAKAVPETSNLRVVVNTLFIDLQRAKFRIVPYAIIQENDPKFFKHVLDTSNSFSFNGKYLGTSYPYSDDPVQSFVRNIILGYGKFDILKDEFYDRVYWRKVLSLRYFRNGLYVNSTTSAEKVDEIVGKFFSGTEGNRSQLNDFTLVNSYINTVSQQMYTFVEYIQGTKLLNDKIFTFSNRRNFNLRPFLNTSVDNRFKNINLGLHLNDNNITLIFNNKILYDKDNKFDFNLLRPELLKSEVVCDAVKIFLRERVISDERFFEIIDEKYGYLSGNPRASLGFNFHSTDYQIDVNLNITSINFTFNDENTLD